MALLDTMHHADLLPAMQQNLTSAVRSLASPRICTRSTSWVTQAWSPVAFPVFNIVAGADPAEPSTISRVLQPYRSHRTPALWFQLGHSYPARADDRLLAHGLTRLEVRPGMAAAIGQVPFSAPAIDVVHVRDEARCRDWAAVQSGANGGFPPLVRQTYVELLMARLDGDRALPAFVAYDEAAQPVACSLLHLGGGVAGLYQVGTVPAARGRGYGRAVTEAALRHAAQLGYRVSVLIATEMGQPLYETLGFRTVLWASVYLFSPEASA